jgi:cytochrome c-type biogenesis protein CcmH/NrfF
VLGAPKNEGFGRAAWLGPVVIIIIGLGMIWVFLRRYLTRRDGPASEKETSVRVDPSVRARIEEELKTHQT